MKDKLKELEHNAYNKLKTELLDVGYLNNNLIRGANWLKTTDKKYLEKIDIMKEYLFDKIKEGDGVAYALVYAAYQDKLSKIDELHNFDKISDYLLTHTELQSNDNTFFDPKVVYFAEVLGNADTLGEV